MQQSEEYNGRIKVRLTNICYLKKIEVTDM